MPVLNCILDNFTGHPATKPLPRVNTGNNLPVRPLLPIQIPIIPDPVDELKSNSGGTLRNLSEDMLGRLPSSPVNSPTIERYPEREGVPERLKDRGYGYGLYEVTVSLWNGVEGSPPVTTKFQEKGPVFGVGYGKEVFDENRKFIGFSRYGLKMGFGTNTPFVRSGFGGFYSASDLSGNEQTVNVINIEPVGQEKESRSPILLQRERNPDREKPIALLLEPINFDLSSAIPPLPTTEPLEPNYNPFEQPKEEENPLFPSVDFPSVRPIIPDTIPPNNPVQNPPGRDRDNPILPGLHPDKKPTLPVVRLPSPLGISGSPSGGTASPPSVRPIIPRSPDDFKIPSVNPDNLGEAKNIIPEPEPCQCNGLEPDEDYMVASIQQVSVPFVTQQGIPPNAIAVENIIQVPVVAIKGKSNAGSVIQEYRQRADLQKKAIENLNKSAQNFNAIGALSLLLNTVNTFLNQQIFTKLNTISQTVDKVWKGVKLLADNPVIDRAIAMITLILVLHNAIQLSNNIGLTATETIDLGLNLVGFQWKTINDDGETEELSTSEIIGNFWENSIKSVLGAENFTNLSVAWKKANRIYQAASGVLDAMQGISDAAMQLNEVTASMTGRIGNALKRFGLVGERAYEWFDEKFDNANRGSRRYPLFNKLEKFGEGVEHLEEIASNTVEIKDSVKELDEARKEFSEATKKNESENSELWEQEKRNAEIRVDLSTLELSSIEED